MRKLKFKAINTKTKCWLDSDNLVCGDGEWYEDWRYFEDAIPLGDDYKIVQYTGADDEYGTEIYEGDILMGRRSLTTVARPVVSGVVRYSDENAMFYLDEVDKQDLPILPIGLSSIYVYKVIGNIYGREITAGKLEKLNDFRNDGSKVEQG